MALQLVIEIQPDYSGDYVWIVENTGPYDVNLNANGWGAPNAERNATALVAYVELLKSTGAVESGFSASPIYFNSLALNTEGVNIKVNHTEDGHYKFYLSAIPGFTTVDGTANIVTQGHYYYDSDTGTVKKLTVDGFVEVTDYKALAEDTDANVISTVNTEEMLTLKLREVARQLYNTYMESRKGTKKDLVAKFDDFLELAEDIKGLDYAFYSGLTSEAQSTIETLNKRFGLV